MPKSAIDLVGFALVLLLLAGCGDSKSGDPGGTTAELSRDELVAALVEKADAFAAEREKNKAYDAYSVALEYAPGGNLGDKLLSVADRPERGMTEEQAQRMLKVIQEAPLDFETRPASTKEIERAELRMLLDSRLAGDLERGSLSAEEQETDVFCFLAAPSMSLDEVATTFGEPSSKAEKDGFRTLTYGRLRLIGDKSGGVIAVLFRSQAGAN